MTAINYTKELTARERNTMKKNLLKLTFCFGLLVALIAMTSAKSTTEKNPSDSYIEISKKPLLEFIFDQDPMGYSWEVCKQESFKLEEIQRDNIFPESLEEKFAIEKEFLEAKYLMEEKTDAIKKLSDKKLRKYTNQLNQLYKKSILEKMPLSEEAELFFLESSKTDTYIETAISLNEQYQIPVSVQLAQIILESAYGKMVHANNVVGLRDGSRVKGGYITTEYYTEKTLKRNKGKVLSQTEVIWQGEKLFRCKVKAPLMAFDDVEQGLTANAVFLNRTMSQLDDFKNLDRDSWIRTLASIRYSKKSEPEVYRYAFMLRTVIQQYKLYLLDA